MRAMSVPASALASIQNEFRKLLARVKPGAA